jgi:hypothetical protein
MSGQLMILATSACVSRSMLLGTPAPLTTRSVTASLGSLAATGAANTVHAMAHVTISLTLCTLISPLPRRGLYSGMRKGQLKEVRKNNEKEMKFEERNENSRGSRGDRTIIGNRSLRILGAGNRQRRVCTPDP